MILFCVAVGWCGSTGRASEPVWIWGSEGAATRAAAGRCDFRHVFSVPSPAEAHLLVTCDNQFIVRLNGRLVGLGDDWQTWQAYDVSQVLKPGENELIVRCRNSDDGPAGLCLNLQITQQDGTRLDVVTGPDWQAKIQPAGTWDPTIEQRTPWGQAFALGPYGKTAPWGDQVAEAREERTVAFRDAAADGPFQLRNGDRVVWVGNTLVERAIRDNLIEAVLATAFPEVHVEHRNLGWSGDTVYGEARARFGTAAEGFEHLETHVYAEEPTVIFVAYGGNEAFDGAAGLEAFRQGYHDLLDVLSGTGAELVLVTPPPHEKRKAPLPDPAPYNAKLKGYRDAIVQIAEQRGCRLVDLFQKLPELITEAGETRPLTDNGMHWNPLGYWYAGQVFLRELELPVPSVNLQIDASNGAVASDGTDVESVKMDGDTLQFAARDHQLFVPAPRTERPDGVASPLQAWRLQVTQLRSGKYALQIDGETVCVASDQQWAEGIDLPTTPGHDQVNALTTQLAKKNELFFHRWRPQNETYLFLFRKHEQGNNAVEIPQFDPLIEAAEQPTEKLASPGLHQFELSRVPE